MMYVCDYFLKKKNNQAAVGISNFGAAVSCFIYYQILKIPDTDSPKQ